MSATPSESFSKTFDLDSKILPAGGSGSVTIGAETAADVLEAIVKNQPFPDRQIDLAGVSLHPEAGRDIKFNAGKGAVHFGGSIDARTRMGVFDEGAAVLKELDLEDTGKINLDLADQDGVRYLLLLAGYGVEGKVNGSHPIGILGTVTFGGSGRRSRLYAVVHRFAADSPARNAIENTVKSWRLPRHVDDPDDLRPGTMLVGEVEGSIALSLGAHLGFDFNFVRETEAFGLTGDIGLKLETGLKVALGFEASGRYLVVLDRDSMESDTAIVRLQLYKLSKKGWSFGLNLSARAQGDVGIAPEKVDDLVKAVFGVHGQQIVENLQAIEKWTDPNTDLSDKVAGLTGDTALELLQQATGIDPKAEFDKAKAVFTKAINQWKSLPDKVSATTWKLIEDLAENEQNFKDFKSTLKLLATDNEQIRKNELGKILERVDFDDIPAGKFLNAAAERGVLALLDSNEDLRKVAATTLDVLNGKIVRKLQGFVNEKLNLDDVIKVATEAEFDALHDWLKKKLSTFLDDELKFEKLDEIKDAINAVLEKRQEIYEKARQALERRYDFEFGYNYQKSTTKTALLDVSFDMKNNEARDLLRKVLVDSNLDDVLVKQVEGVTLGQGVLTHEINRQSSVQLNMPFYSTKTDSINNSLAKVRAEEDGGRILFYELEATDEVTTRDRMKSQLAIASALPLRLNGAVRLHSSDSSTWSYQYRQINENLNREELERQIRPYIEEYLPEHFGGTGQSSSLSAWITDLDRRVEEAVDNGSDEFGDTLLSMEVSLPGSVLGAWFPGEKRGATAGGRARHVDAAPEGP